MVKYKYLTTLSWYNEFFDELKIAGYVTREYHWHSRKIAEIGKLFLRKEGETIEMCIASNYSQSDYTNGRYRDSRLMYVLNEDGIQYIKTLIVDAAI